MPALKNRMIMTRTPLRITFTGGGTDIGAYYRLNGPGAVVNAAINKYIYIIVNKKFDNEIRVSYSKTEIVPHVEDIQHPSIREALRLLGIDGGIEIVSISDIPSGGTGLGSSSSFLVGLLNALHAWNGELVPPRQLAEEAVHIARDVLKEPGGKQDEYIAAYGGLQFMEFNKDESVAVRPVVMTEEARTSLRSHLQMLYTGKQRNSGVILKKQSDSAKPNLKSYDAMRDLAYRLYENLTKGNWQDTGRLLHENWMLKKKLEGSISDKTIDGWYDRARKAGALGGKIIGAGGGGFLLLFTPPSKQEAVRKALPGLTVQEFELEPQGSSIVYVGD